MQTLIVDHRTEYRYRRPVRFGEHRLMIRPRDSHDLRLVDSTITIAPTAEIRWQHDVFGNSVALATFNTSADRLVFESRITVELYDGGWPDYPIAGYAQVLPFAYAADEVLDLGRAYERHFDDPEDAVSRWARAVLADVAGHGTWPVLLAMTSRIASEFRYERRESEGVQSPAETFARQAGTCRDFAVYLMEAARCIGLAARFVTGYLYDPETENGSSELLGGGATHAWTQIFVPGAGWVELDPTNGQAGGSNLIRVGVARDPNQALPIRGSFFGDADDFETMSAQVTVRRAL